MNYLLDHMGAVADRFKDNALVLFLDYDGTLAPIAPTPDQALMTQGIREILMSLSQVALCRVIIISGRRLADLKSRVSIPGLTYVGNHGFEMEGAASFNVTSAIPARYGDDIRKLKGLLSETLSALEGVWIEDKGLVLTVHFRSASPATESMLRDTFEGVCRDYLQARRIKVMEGKKVLEIRPPLKWGKGDAACRILAECQQQWGPGHVLAVYVGDDVTDEEAFGALNPSGLTVKVGDPSGSCAQYFLRSQEEVIVLLRKIQELTASRS